jgi:hypothetical protein
LGRIARIFLAGLLVLLPILVTVIVTVWVAQLLQSYAGPNSLTGRVIVLLGLNLVSSDTGAYCPRLSHHSRLHLPARARGRDEAVAPGANGPRSLISRVPLVSNVYDLSKRFVAIVDAAATRTVCKACARCGASSAGRVALPCSG